MSSEPSFPFTREFARAAADLWYRSEELKRLSGHGLMDEIGIEGRRIVVGVGSGRPISVMVTNEFVDYAYADGVDKA